MRKFLLCFSMFICSLLALAQYTTNGLEWQMTQPADNTVTLSWKYASADVNTIFQIYRTDVATQGESTQLLREIKAAEIVGHETNAQGQEVPIMGVVPGREWEVSIYGLDLTGVIGYKFAIKVLNKTEEVMTVPVYLSNPGYDATTVHYFTYGLTWQEPMFTNEKSSSVTLNWKRHPQNDGTFVYTVYGIEHNVVLGSTTENSYLLTNLEPEVAHIFMVRAYKDGKYMASTPSSKAYTPKRVDCITFISASANKKDVTLSILGYDGDGNPFSTDKSAYDLVHNGATVTCNSIDQNGVFSFRFNDNVDVTKEFKLVTQKNEGGKEVDAIGLFTLNTTGTAIEIQTCDIVYDLKVTHVTQHTVTFTWTDPGFDADNAILEFTPEGGETKSIEVPNPKVYTYSLGGLEHSTNYTFVLKLSDKYHNQAKATVKATTKVGSICGLENIQSGSASLGCGDGEFLMPYDLEFYTAYRDADKKPYVVIRFKPKGTQQINDVKIYATTERGTIADLANLTSKSMSMGEDGWYTCELDKYGLLWWKTDITNDMNIRFAVSVKHNDGCKGNLFGMDNNTYITKFASYKVSTGCQDDEVYSVIKFTKTYATQSQLTLQTNGRVASLGVFTEAGYISDTKFDLNERVFYNSFDDAPSKFTLDIADYEVGTYYMHIHDVYGEAGSLKYLWAIY